MTVVPLCLKWPCMVAENNVSLPRVTAASPSTTAVSSAGNMCVFTHKILTNFFFVLCCADMAVVAWLAVAAVAVVASASVPDWLVTTITQPVEFQQLDSTTYQLTNGLISRIFTLSPDFGTINFYSYTTEASLMRAIYPEAMVTIDGVLDASCALAALMI